MNQEYLKTVLEVARQLNKAYSLSAALRHSLEKTIELLGLETGWIWLVEPDHKSVYLAASKDLPPALSQHPERLSGWCYCIKKYLSSEMEKAANISEITCTRLKDLSSGTKGLKYHATIPITVEGEKVGIMNLMCPSTQQLGNEQLMLLNTISELIGLAVQRTRLQEHSDQSAAHSTTDVQKILIQVVNDRIKDTVSALKQAKGTLAPVQINTALNELSQLMDEIEVITSEQKELPKFQKAEEFHYPASPLTKRELEVLQCVKTGSTNAQIAEQLFVTERTVKFHITSILSKFHAKTRTEAVDIAFKRGLLN